MATGPGRSCNTAPRGATSTPYPSSGHTWWLLLPTVSVAAFTLALREFAQAIRAGRGQQILLVLDGAGWYSSPHVRVPVRVHVYFLPPYSPA